MNSERSARWSTTPVSSARRRASMICPPNALHASWRSMSPAAFFARARRVKRMSTRHGGKGGVIVNLSSVAAKLGSPNTYVDYAASKGRHRFLHHRSWPRSRQRRHSRRGDPARADRYRNSRQRGEPDRAHRLSHKVPMKRCRRRARDRQRHRLADVGRCLLRHQHHPRCIGWGVNTSHSNQLRDFNHGHLRSRYYRHRSGRICCAVRAAQLGHEGCRGREERNARRHCLNVGCMPSKALLHASEMFEEAGHSFAKWVSASPRRNSTCPR